LKLATDRDQISWMENIYDKNFRQNSIKQIYKFSIFSCNSL
jgi:hypothetical protein